MESDKVKICPICKCTFICEHSVNCWCSSIQIPEKVRTYLKRNFDDCLCEKCLQKIILKEEKNNPGTIIAH